MHGRPPHFHASRRVGALRPAEALLRMSALELLLFGALCYVLGFVSGAVVIPWLVDHGLFPLRRLVRTKLVRTSPLWE